MEKIMCLLFIEFVCKKCIRIQDNIVSYKGKYYVTYGAPFDDVKSTSALYEIFINL